MSKDTKLSDIFGVQEIAREFVSSQAIFSLPAFAKHRDDIVKAVAIRISRMVEMDNEDASHDDLPTHSIKQRQDFYSEALREELVDDLEIMNILYENDVGEGKLVILPKELIIAMIARGNIREDENDHFPPRAAAASQFFGEIDYGFWFSDVHPDPSKKSEFYAMLNGDNLSGEQRAAFIVARDAFLIHQIAYLERAFKPDNFAANLLLHGQKGFERIRNRISRLSKINMLENPLEETPAAGYFFVRMESFKAVADLEYPSDPDGKPPINSGGKPFAL